ncbi:hypothetical protein BS47DRAFT_1352285 [Hydnum rufescens UP504]|uniref:Uncharacterized protein n=1 Tax=Hydnum rufescens UP504 TaxID=1448309 RepID=A0A9P6AJY3_9AGAM|nr:hypothetical protein BS47DRAFT_1352285 [Hydnum rufescens UP504]
MSSAATTSFSNAVITTSRAHRSAGPFRIQFGSDWQHNGIMDWYHSLGPRPTKINTFQLRMEKSKPLKHQYVVLILSGDSILRLDRRGDETNPMNAVTSVGTESIDTIEDVDSLSNLDKSSSCLAELHCQGSDVDLSNIIKICFGIHSDDKAGRYTLQRFNCYFFSWTMLVVIARHAVPWDRLPFDSPWETLSQTLAHALSTKFADTLINMLVDGGLIITMEIYLKLKRQLSRAVSRRARIAWAMPQWLIRLALRAMIRSSWRSKMHTFLRFRLRSELLSALQPTLRSVLADLRVSTLRTTLWKDDVGDAMRGVARRDVMASILNAGTTALSSISLTMEDADAFQSLVVTFAHRDFLEARRGGAALVAGFNAIMQATPLFAAHGADGFVTDDTKWDEVWNSIRDTIREAAKGAMKDVEEGRWAALGDALMEEWVAGWEVMRPKMRETVRSTVTEMTDLVSDALAYSVVKTLPDTHLYIGVRPMIPSRLRHVSHSKFIAALADVTHSELQPYVLKLIRDHGSVVGRYQPGSSAKVGQDMREAMDRVWRAVLDLDGGGARLNDNRTADVL